METPMSTYFAQIVIGKSGYKEYPLLMMETSG